MEHLIKEKLMNMLIAYEDRIYEEMAKLGERFSEKYGISPSTAISVILGCVCLLMLVKRRRWEPNQSKQKQKQKPRVLERSKSFGSLYGGDFALRRLEDYKVAQALPSTLERSHLVLKGLLEEEHLDFKKLQSVTARLEMAGNEEEAVKILEEAKTKNAQLQKSHHVYEIDMLLVEMLIYSGKHDEAKKCECLKKQKMLTLDARRPLFKAIIYGMREEWGKSESFWNKFVELREAIMEMVGQERQVGLGIKDFQDLEKKVKHLHAEIDRRKSSQSSLKARLYSGDVALSRLQDFNNPNNKALPYTSSSTTIQRGDDDDEDLIVFKSLLQQSHLDLNKLQREIARVDMSGRRGDERVKLLSEAAKERADKSVDVYEIEILLVEMLIYMGRANEALQFQCLNRPQNPLDARPPLFKAIIYGMRNEWEEAERCWNEFTNLRAKSMQNVGLQGLVHEITNFDMLKEKVQCLQNEIANKSP